MTLQLPPVNYAQQSGAFIQSELGQVGIKVKIQNVDFPLWINRVFIGGNYDLTIIAHVEARDLIKYADPKYYWHYDNKTVQKLIAAGDAAPTDAQWIADYRKVERIITTDAVNDWLFLLPNLEVVRKGITGYPTNGLSLSFDVTGLRRELTASTDCSASPSSATSRARMRDGVVLRADVYRPLGGGVHPVLLLRLPYDKTAAEQQLGYSPPVLVRAAGLHGGRAGHARALHVRRQLLPVPQRGGGRLRHGRVGGARCRGATGVSACTDSRTREPCSCSRRPLQPPSLVTICPVFTGVAVLRRAGRTTRVRSHSPSPLPGPRSSRSTRRAHRRRGRHASAARAL